MVAKYDEFPRWIDTSEMEPPLTKGQAEEAIRKHHEALRRDEGARVKAFLARNRQEGGTHYKNMVIQPAEYCHRNGLGYCESIAVRYVSRWKSKGGIEDIKKAIHALEILLEMESSNDR